MIQVTAFDAVTPAAQHRCFEAPELDMHTDLIRWQGSTFVYRCTDLSVAIDLRDYLNGTIPGVTIRFANA